MKNWIKVISSGSSGNSLAIYDSRGRYIIVDVGLPYKDILQSCNFKISDWSAALCSHR